MRLRDAMSTGFAVIVPDRVVPCHRPSPDLNIA
jgi:hypothetical protein